MVLWSSILHRPGGKGLLLWAIGLDRSSPAPSRQTTTLSIPDLQLKKSLYSCQLFSTRVRESSKGSSKESTEEMTVLVFEFETTNPTLRHCVSLRTIHSSTDMVVQCILRKCRTPHTFQLILLFSVESTNAGSLLLLRAS
jgi:hypothetical protein